MPVSYGKYRRDLIQGYYDYQLETLMMGFDHTKPTVILLPGGMGSQLERSEHKYPASPNVINDVIWMDPGILAGDALDLEITSSDEDLDRHVVAAHGPFRFLTETPYDDLKQLAQTKQWNYGVFGYDWRRSLDESAEYFKEFIWAFKKRIENFGADLGSVTIVCHSMGGMVCAYALTDPKFNSLKFHAIVTVATPFYGTSTQQERNYVGVPGILNTIYTPKTVVDIVSSLPGPYTLMFLPKSIYNQDGAKLGLTRYPQFDPNGNVDADPYDPALMSRWPKPVKAHKKYLLDAKKEMEKVAKPISPNIVKYFFNVRSSKNAQTAVQLSWNNVNGDTFVPGKDPSPLAGIAGPGDGTVPAWSAWHAYSLPNNRHELKLASDHGNLLKHPEVLGVIETIVKTRKLPAPKAKGPAKLGVASEAKVAAATEKWIARAKVKKPPPDELFTAPVKNAIFSQLIGGPKPRLSRRQAPPPAAAPAKRKKRK